MADRYFGFTSECLGGSILVAGNDLGFDVALENVTDLKKKNLGKLYSRGVLAAISGLVNWKSGGRDKAAKFSEGMFYAALPIAELAAYHYARS